MSQKLWGRSSLNGVSSTVLRWCTGSRSHQWRYIVWAHQAEGVSNVLFETLIDFYPVIRIKYFGRERWISIVRGHIHFHLNSVPGLFRRATSADRGFSDKAGTKLPSNWEWKPREGLEDRRLPSACVANDNQLQCLNQQSLQVACSWGIQVPEVCLAQCCEAIRFYEYRRQRQGASPQHLPSTSPAHPHHCCFGTLAITCPLQASWPFSGVFELDFQELSLHAASDLSGHKTDRSVN
jgi:hypothetical protein